MTVDLKSARDQLGPRLHLAYLWVLGIVVLISLLKGFRMPNLWAATQFAIHYGEGFVRRGLVGEIARHLGGPEIFHYYHFAVVAFSCLLVTLAITGWLMLRAVKRERDDVSFKLAMLVACASPGAAFFVHEVGYLDYYGFLAVIVVIALARGVRITGLLFAFVWLVGLGLCFVHEVLAVMFGPTLVLVMLCATVARWRHHPGSPWQLAVFFGSALFIFASWLIISGWIGTHGSASPEKMASLARDMRTAVDFPLRPDVLEAETRSSMRNLTRLMPWYWGMIWKLEPLPPIKSWLAIFPSLSFLLVYGQLAIRELRLHPLFTLVLGLGFAGAMLAPLTLNLVGWDWNRWNAMSLLAGLSGLLALRLLLPNPGKSPVRPFLLGFGAIALCLSLASDNVLFDLFQVQFYPFEKQFEFLLDLFEKDFTYRPRG